MWWAVWDRFHTRPERYRRSDHGASAPVRPQDPPTRILANSGILLFSCVPMFESLLKLHPRDPSLVRLNARGIARLLVRLLPRELHKSSRCTGKLNCQCPPPWVDSGSTLHRRVALIDKSVTRHALVFISIRTSTIEYSTQICIEPVSPRPILPAEKTREFLEFI